MRMRFLLIAIGFGVSGICIGVISADLLRKTPPIVIVEVVNSSGKRINEIQLVHSRGMVQLTDIASEERANLAFYLTRETGYRIRVTFNDLQVLEGRVGYVQSASNWSAIVTAGEIKIQNVSNY